MPSQNSELLELRLDYDGEYSARISLPQGMKITAGQYLMAHAPAHDEPLATPLFPAQVDIGVLEVAPSVPSTWNVGDALVIRGPYGRGFHLPENARKVALAALGVSRRLLQPLVQAAVKRGAEVSFYSDEETGGLPPEVEVLPIDQLPGALTWADALALALPLAGLDRFKVRLGLRPGVIPAVDIQVLVYTAMPCAGMALCGVCSVHTRQGWKLACQDGPVFDFRELDLP